MRIAEADVVDMVNDKATRAAWTMWRNRRSAWLPSMVRERR